MNVYYVLQLLFVTRLLNDSSLTRNNSCVIIMQSVSECSIGSSEHLENDCL